MAFLHWAAITASPESGLREEGRAVGFVFARERPGKERVRRRRRRERADGEMDMFVMFGKRKKLQPNITKNR